MSQSPTMRELTVSVEITGDTYRLLDGGREIAHGDLTADGKNAIVPLTVLKNLAHDLTGERFGSFHGAN